MPAQFQFDAIALNVYRVGEDYAKGSIGLRAQLFPKWIKMASADPSHGEELVRTQVS